MGLDTLAQRGPDTPPTDDDLVAFDAAGVRLCECDGDATFRGKLYVDIVLEATGESLTQEWISPVVVRRMAGALECADPTILSAALGKPTPEVARDLRELRRFFRVCAERDLGVAGSW